jgi:hypothetical protein
LVELLAARRAVLRLTHSLACVLAIAIGLLAVLPSQAAEDRSPDAALARLLQEGRAAAPGACTQSGTDRLIRILCAGHIRIGVRDQAGFAIMTLFQRRLSRAVMRRRKDAPPQRG